jgi:hypothetical protein
MRSRVEAAFSDLLTGKSEHMRIAALVMMVAGLPAAALAQEERLLNGAEILESLADHKVIGEKFEQSFGNPSGHESASTSYWEGNNGSFGRWRVEGNEYCSQWPPAEFWVCYKVAITNHGDGQKQITWIASDGTRYVGRLED